MWNMALLWDRITLGVKFPLGVTGVVEAVREITLDNKVGLSAVIMNLVWFRYGKCYGSYFMNIAPLCS